MLNSAENEIFPAYKSQITNNCKFFLAIINFSAIINMKMPTTAFSYLLAEKISCSAELSMKKSFIALRPHNGINESLLGALVVF